MENSGCEHRTVRTRKEEIWLACKEKKCCHDTFVVPSGRDIERIARVLDTPPWTFLMYFFTPDARRDAFKLDRSGRYFRLALAKQPAQRKKKMPPCIFLVRTRHGYHRCGLGDLRPMVCRAFPVELASGILYIPSTGCSCRSWSLTDVDLEDEFALLEQRRAETETYCRIVASWNAEVDSAGEDTGFEFADFCRYIVAAYQPVATSTLAQHIHDA